MKLDLFIIVALVLYTSATDVHIALRQQNLYELYDNAWSVSDPRSPNFLQFWTEEEIRDLVSPPLKVRREIVNWLHTIGVSPQVIQDRGDSIVFPYDPVYAKRLMTTKPTLRVAETIDMIIGLEPGSRIIRSALRGTDEPGYVGREVIERLYNVSSLSGSVDIGVVQYEGGDGFSQSDLRAYQAANGLVQKNVSAKHIIGTKAGPGGEGELDIQMISNLAGANLWFISISGWIYDFASEFFTWKQYPTVLSHSYGWAEDDQCLIVKCTNFTSADYIRRTNTELAKIALKGVTLLVSSGDAGSPGRTAEICTGKPKTNPIFPGSSPWVVSVGATYIIANSTFIQNLYTTPLCQKHGCVSGTLEEETVFNMTQWTSGSGFGIYSEARNKWQNVAVKAYLNSGVHLPPESAYNRHGRAYPDISTVGHNCAVYMYGGLRKEDGTSCSSPVMAALVGYISSRLNTRLGVFTPLLYDLYYTEPGTFNDITVGHSECTEAECCNANWGFEATKGWDAASGLGTPNVDRIVEKLGKYILS
uniref:Peptidase S53 n=1 Tax=Marseillevirus LCMAC201 TaxID=2506605 RepID=A0A481YWZ5_9VIRU|nr:MAG: peptidase S53 [Marseillevirus LCMAC201]